MLHYIVVKLLYYFTVVTTVEKCDIFSCMALISIFFAMIFEKFTMNMMIDLFTNLDDRVRVGSCRLIDCLKWRVAYDVLDFCVADGKSCSHDIVRVHIKKARLIVRKY